MTRHPGDRAPSTSQPAPDTHRDNQLWWDERAEFHLDTPLYRRMVERLEAGQDTFLPLDDEVLGDVRRLDVLHLQCHVGTETISFARRGARVTGVDFSAEALRQAEQLAERFGLTARYVQSSIETLGRNLAGTFDLVYTSYGALCWIRDLEQWARTAARFVAPGGRLIVIDGHPLVTCLAEDDSSNGLRLEHPYLRREQPLSCDTPGSYADPNAATQHNIVHEWTFGIGDVVQAVLDSGLTLRRLTENPTTFFPARPGFVQRDDGLWQLPPALHGQYPLSFTLVATKPTARASR